MKILLLRNKSCRRREQEEYRIRSWMRGSSHFECKLPEEADLIIFTSCAFDKYTYDLAADQLRKLLPFKDKTIVAGCIPDLAPELVEGFKTVTLYELDKHLGIDVPDSNVQHPGVHISHGCMGNCNYCGINKATKRHRSVPLETIKEAVDAKQKAGMRPLLLGEDTGCWGLDIGSSLPDLLNQLDGEVFLDNMGAHWFMRYYESLRPLLLSGRIYRIEVAMQSFSPKLVANMNRPTDYDFTLLAKRLRYLADKRMEQTGLPYTDQLDLHLLSGHPLETKEDRKIDRSILRQYIQDTIPYTSSPFFRYRHCELPPTESYHHVSIGPVPWICDSCNMKIFDCICDNQHKGYML